MITKKCPYCGKEILDVYERCNNCNELLNKEDENSNGKEYIEKHKSNILTLLCFIAILFAFISFAQVLFSILNYYGIRNSIIISIKNIFIFIPEWFTTLFGSTIFIILIYAIIKYYHSIINDTHLFYQLIFLEILIGLLELLSIYQGKNISYALMILIPMITIYIMGIMLLIGIKLTISNKKNLLHKLGIGFIALSITRTLELTLIIFFGEIAIIGLLLNLFFKIYTLYQIKNLFAK